MFGRPDWMTIYGQMKQAIESGQYIPGSKSQLKTKVAVRIHARSLPPRYVLILVQTYFCGPGAIASALKEATTQHSSSSVNFTFAKVCLSVPLGICNFADDGNHRNTSNASLPSYVCAVALFFRHRIL